MLWRMLRQSWGRNLRRKVLAIITVFLASSLISALLAVSIDIGDKNVQRAEVLWCEHFD